MSPSTTSGFPQSPGTPLCLHSSFPHRLAETGCQGYSDVGAAVLVKFAPHTLNPKP